MVTPRTPVADAIKLGASSVALVSLLAFVIAGPEVAAHAVAVPLVAGVSYLAGVAAGALRPREVRTVFVGVKASATQTSAVVAEVSPVPAPAPAAVSTTCRAPVVRALEALLSGPLPEGLSLDADGWLRGSQRRIAAAAGCPLKWLNQGLRDAAAAGHLELDTSNNRTAIKLAA